MRRRVVKIARGRHGSFLGVRMLVLARVLAALVAGCSSCEEEPPPETPPPATAPPPPVVAPRAVATVAAFDLVAVPGGALLAFGPPAEQGGGVHALLLSPIGERVGEDVVLFERAPTEAAPVAPYALEISAASGGGRVAVAWVVRDGLDASVGAAQGTAEGPVFGPPSELAPTEAPDRVRRGLLALAGAPDGTMSLLHRAGRGPCADSARTDCVQLAITRLGGTPGASEREGVGLAVPEVCETPVAGHVWADGTWYYGVCAVAADRPETTVYAIRFEPEYAHADQVLAGCAPLGLARVGEGAAMLLGRCGAERVDAVRFGDVGQSRRDLASVTRAVRCVDGRPTLSVGAPGGAVEVVLAEPASGIAALLPESIAPEHARAVWTGRALLVATPSGREVRIERHECDDGELRRSDTL
jgi:hypothetical protein